MINTAVHTNETLIPNHPVQIYTQRSKLIHHCATNLSRRAISKEMRQLTRKKIKKDGEDFSFGLIKSVSLHFIK